MVARGLSVTVREVDRGWKRITAFVGTLKKGNAYAKVGVLDNGGLGSAMRGPLTQAMIALVLEYGTQDGRIPGRHPLGITFDKIRGDLEAMASKLVKQIFEGRMTVERALGLMALKLVSEIKKTIATGPPLPPPNAASTLKKKEGLTRKGAKKAARTLIDTGRFVASFTYALVIGGPK